MRAYWAINSEKACLTSQRKANEQAKMQTNARGVLMNNQPKDGQETSENVEKRERYTCFVHMVDQYPFL